MPFDPYLPDDTGLTTEQVHDLYVLREALRHIQQPYGWCRRTMDGPGGSHCAVGWIVHLTDGSPWELDGDWQRIVREHLVPGLPLFIRWRKVSNQERVFSFNDIHGREAVIKLFKLAIARIEAQRR
jgi:hypothetical protein